MAAVSTAHDEVAFPHMQLPPDLVAKFFRCILCADAEGVRRMRQHVDFLNMSFDIYGELPADTVERVGRVCAASKGGRDSKRESFSNEEYFSALLYLAMFSTPVMEGRLGKLNPAALDYVIESLSGGEFHPAMIHYGIIREKLLDAGILPKAVEKACMEATEGER